MLYCIGVRSFTLMISLLLCLGLLGACIMANYVRRKCCIPYCDIIPSNGAVMFPIPAEPGSNTSEWFKRINQMHGFSASHPLYLKEEIGAVICSLHFIKSIYCSGNAMKLTKNQMPTFFPWSPQWPLLPEVNVVKNCLFIHHFIYFLMTANVFIYLLYRCIILYHQIFWPRFHSPTYLRRGTFAAFAITALKIFSSGRCT